MERNFNIAEILKNKPKGTKLYADAFGELSIEEICTEDNNGITLSDNGGTDWLFYNDGKYSWRGESILVPSKEMRDWNKFAWKKGDVLVNSRGLKILFDRWANDKYTSFYAKTINLVEDAFLDTNLHTLASEKEAKSFVKYIEEKLGGKLNLESLEIEKQPEFIEWVRKKHGVPTNHEIIMELKNIGNLCRSTDILAYNEIKALIEKLEK